MRCGNIIKITETVKHNKRVKKKTTIGRIIAIDNKLTICRIKDGVDTWNITYSLGDLKDKSKQFFFQDGEAWKQAIFTTKEREYNALEN
jgi:hypothetical protein